MKKEEAALRFKALGDLSRLRIVKYLYNKGETCACKFLDIIECGQPTLSHHLKILTEAGLVSVRRDGTKMMYSCNKEAVDELMAFISTPCGCCNK